MSDLDDSRGRSNHFRTVRYEEPAIELILQDFTYLRSFPRRSPRMSLSEVSSRLNLNWCCGHPFQLKVQTVHDFNLRALPRRHALC